PEAADLARECEVAVRLALSCVVAAPGEGGAGRLVTESVRIR
ncbi:TetR/AcrR family transcriptional regulator, partial [Streptomyces sp. T-3]|nr:TetR/AcrR family transcriptional regulator [Streptomyces sp. T-3]